MDDDDIVVRELPEIAATDKCNARNSDLTKYCKKTAGWGTDHVGTGRCKLHGGSSLKGFRHPNFLTGKYSKVLPDNLLGHFEDIMADGKLLELKEDIALVTTLVRSSLQDLQENYQSSAAYFKQMTKVIDELEQTLANGEHEVPYPIMAALQSFIEIFRLAQNEQAKRQEILTMLEQKRKLAESEQKRLVSLHNLFSADQIVSMMASVLSIIRAEVHDISTQEKIAEGIRKLINKSQKKLTD